MKIDKQVLKDHQVRLVVEVEQEKIQSAERNAAVQLAKHVKIPGFRPGKAPINMVRRYLGDAEIRKEAFQNLVEEIYPQIIEEADIEPYGPGTLENIKDDGQNPAILEFVIPLEAEVELGDYRIIREPYEPPQVTDQEVEDVLRKLAEEQVVVETVDRPAEEGDLLQVRITARKTEVEAGREDEAILINDRSVPVTIEKEQTDTQDEWPFSGFSRHLIGLSTNDETQLLYKYPEDSPFESLRGIEAQFDIKIENVSKRNLPVMDDEFAKSVGDYETLEELREAIRADLNAQALENYHDQYDKKVLSKVIECSSFKYPPQMIDDETENALNRLESRLEQQGFSLDFYAKTRRTDRDGLVAEMRQSAEDRIKRTLVLLQLSREEKIEVLPEEAQSKADMAINILEQAYPKEKIKQMYSGARYDELIEKIAFDEVMEKALKRLREIAQGVYDSSQGQSQGVEETSNPTDTETSES